MNFLNSQKGSALLVALAVMLLLFLVVMNSVDTSLTESQLSFNQLHSDKAFYVAQAGIERATVELELDDTWRGAFANEPFDGGAFSVISLDSVAQPALVDTVVLRSVGTHDNARSQIEVRLIQERYHPLYNYAIYGGNSLEYDPSLPVDSQSWIANMSFSGSGSDADDITGDVFFNGHLDFTDDAVLDGTAYAGAGFTGNAPTGGMNTNQDYLEPPDLRAESYETNADFYVGAGSGWDAQGRIAEADPRHIFVKDFRSDLATDMGYSFDNENYFFGDPWEDKDIDKVSVSAAGNHKTYFIDGNLWIEPQGTVSRLINSPPEGTQITIVAKGNIYFSDNLSYDNDDLDGLAFIAMTDGESYNDIDGDGKYDAGEPILHDDGDGVYEGPSEGSGNVRFGDPNGGPLGDIHGYLYAENNFEDYVLDGPDGRPQDFSVTGSLSAGNQLNIRRDYGVAHSKMDITYDDRLQKGEINLPGLPRRNATGSGNWVRVAWREL